MVKPIAELLNQTQARMSSQDGHNKSTTKSGSPAWKRTEQVLIRLGNIYGHLFTSQWKTDAAFDLGVSEWCDSIGHHDYAKLTRAVTRCKAEYKKPPSLPEFMEMFKFTQEQALNAGHFDSDAPKLPAPVSKYKDGVSPAKLLADSIVTTKQIIENRPIKSMNDVEHEARIKAIEDGVE